MTRQRRTFTPEFKLQLVKLYENGLSTLNWTKIIGAVA
ncbi:transposase [Metasolibacillus sp.]|nr:transposase [Metasolibacillus sp.]MCT6924212.1 transposase [Metasolibacillus sp.]MCT6940386.1 transposase [Metasolibacillus sp.]